MGNRGMTIFWVLYMLFFAIPFPMILYYTITYSGGQRYESTLSAPTAALAYLALSIVLWSLTLIGRFKRWVLLAHDTKHRISVLLREGTRRTATILSAVKTGKRVKGLEEYDLVLSFENFAQETITEKIRLIDSKPLEKRFEAGKELRIRVDNQVKKQPVLIPEDSTASVNRTYWLVGLLGWLLLLCAVIWYYYFSYRLESRGTGWRFLVFWHPLVLCPLILWGYRVLLVGVLGRIFGLSGSDPYLKYHGQRTMAKVISAMQTGTYINNQPQVKFDLAYQDQNGQNHQVSLKKIVSLLNMNTAQQGEVEIFYLKDDPKQVAFAADFATR